MVHRAINLDSDDILWLRSFDRLYFCCCDCSLWHIVHLHRRKGGELGLQFERLDDAPDVANFTALPGGRRLSASFDQIGDGGAWWSSTDASATYYWCRSLSYSVSYSGSPQYNKKSGLSVRCIKD